MKLLRPLVILACLILLVTAAALWWNQPARVDMANYAPADSLVYIEINSIPDITNAIQQSEAWKTAAPIIGVNTKPQSRWTLVAARAGVAPVQAVISSRAQMALVVVGVNTAEKDDLLRVKPEVALVIETHTAKWRMKSAAVAAIHQLAKFAYGDSICTERVGDADYIECTEPNSARKLIGAISGTHVIIGNSDKAVETCLEVQRGQRPSLRTDPELSRSRTNLKSDSALAFGFVSQANAARLVSWAAPLLMGKAPGDQQLEQLLANSATKVLRGVAWTSVSSEGGIEDRYQISLEPEVVKRLEPAFETVDVNEDHWKLIPDSFRSLTIYRSKDPQAAWFSLDSALAMKLDALSSVIFASLLKSGLSGYGIENPKEVISELAPPVVTLRPILGEGSLLLARVKNEEQLRRALANNLLKEGRGQILSGIQSEPVKEKEFTAVLVDGFVVMGKTENILIYLAQVRNNEVLTPDHLAMLKLGNRLGAPAVVTYTNERASLTSSIGALSTLNGRTLSGSELEAIQSHLNTIDVSCTESSLNSSGIERRTRSAFGQFGSLLAFAQADSSTSLKR
jgi:hypothetical protein